MTTPLILAILTTLIITTNSSEVTCTPSVSTSYCINGCSCSCNSSSEISCTITPNICHKLNFDLCINNCFCAVPPPNPPPIVTCTPPVSTSFCINGCSCSCNSDDEVSCTISEITCHQSHADLCLDNFFCVAPPPKPDIGCEVPISAQSCFEDCDCSCGGDGEGVKCSAGEDRCPGAIARRCEEGCECLNSEERFILHSSDYWVGWFWTLCVEGDNLGWRSFWVEHGQQRYEILFYWYDMWLGEQRALSPKTK